MILYRGTLYENSRQEELIASLARDVYAPIREGRSLSAERVISACDSLAQRVLEGEFDGMIQPFLTTFGISHRQFADQVQLFTREGLSYKCAVELRDEETVIDGKVLRKRYPLGVLLHIAAGNVDILPAYSVIEGLLSGNINILKLPMGDSGLSVRLLRELIRLEPELKDYIYVFDVPSTETETLKKLADLSDGVVVWGGDGAVKAARNMVSLNTKIIAWGHKLSFAYAEPDAEDQQLYDLAKSVCDTDQLLCSSCQGIFVDTESREELLAFANRFFKVFRQANRESNPVDYGMKAKNAISLYNARLEQNETGDEILSADGISVIVKGDMELELSLLYRNVWIKAMPMDEIHRLKKNKNYLQTAAVLTADPEKRRSIAERLAAVGVVRITSPGSMSRMIRGEAHDGTYALREYSRIVETELI